MPTKKETKAIELTARDLALLRGLFEGRVLTLAHIASLYFDGSKDAAKKRLQKLKATGLIRERPRKVSEAATLFLAPAAYETLEQKGILKEYPPIGRVAFEKRNQVSAARIAHELDVATAKSALAGAMKGHSAHELETFCTWPLLYQFDVPDYSPTEKLVQPDGFVRIRECSDDGDTYEHNFFVEVDRSNEAQGVLASKAAKYLHFYRTGGFAKRLGLSTDSYKDAPFRVLALFKTDERRNNTAERLLKIDPPIRTLVWLATLAEFERDALGPIWIRPHDYEKAVAGTAFAVAAAATPDIYRRNRERERFIDSAVQRLRLFEDV